MGIFNTWALPDVRRRGAAITGLRTQARWRQALGGTHLYLQVMEENPGALAL